jgi:outer membrane lipoprotein-sorting protein
MNTLINRITRKLGTAAISTMGAGALAVCTTIALPVAVLAPGTPAVAQTRPAQGNSTLNRAAAALRGITTMRADFTQTDRSGQSLSGTLTLRNPGRIRFEYSRDVNMLVVSNGSTLTLIDYDVQQVERWPISNSPLGALLDPNRDVSRYGRVMPTAASNVISIAVEDPRRPEFGQITLIFVEKAGVPGGLELTSWVALDAQNTRTTVRLRNQRYGIAVPDSTFTYRDPRRSGRRPG